MVQAREQSPQLKCTTVPRVRLGREVLVERTMLARQWAEGGGRTDRTHGRMRRAADQRPGSMADGLIDGSKHALGWLQPAHPDGGR